MTTFDTQRLVFFGTPEFAVPCLDALIQSGRQIEAVVTQPDKPFGRGKKLKAPPIKEYALEKGITIYQPKSLRKGRFDEVVQSFQSKLQI